MSVARTRRIFGISLRACQAAPALLTEQSSGGKSERQTRVHPVAGVRPMHVFRRDQYKLCKACTRRAKGNPVPIPEPGSGTVQKSGPRKRVRRGNPKRPGDAVGRSGKSFLFCMSVRVPWNPLAGRYGLEREEHRSCGGVPIFPSDLENPGEGHVEQSRRLVPISAAGLQG